MTVTVPKEKPVRVSKRKAWRLLLGRFIVRFIEALGPSLVGTTIFVPANTAGWQVLGMALLVPLTTAAINAGRSVWPDVRKWLDPSAT